MSASNKQELQSWKPPRFRSLRQKLVVANAAIMLVLLVLQIIVYVWVTRGQVADSVRLNDNLVDSVGRNADVAYRDTVSQINVVTMNERLQELLTVPTAADTENHAVNREIRSLVNDRFLSLDTADAIYLRDNRGVQRLYWRRTNLPEMLRSTIAFDELEIPETGLVAATIHDGHLIFARRILSLKDYEYVGDLALVYNKSKLTALLADLAQDSARELTIYDSDGDLIVSTLPIQEATELATARVAEQEPVNPSIFGPGSDRIISTYDSEESEWTMVSAISFSDVTQTARTILSSLMLGTAVVWLLGFFLIRAVSNAITDPLRHMVRVSRAEDSEYKQRYQVDTGDELEVLADTLNELMARTGTLVNQVLRDEIKYRDVQLQALQSQINPHMLNNTLECINWLAELGRKEDIRKVTVAFSHIMDALADSKRSASIREELELVDAFIEIYQILLLGQLSYEVEVEESLLCYELPRLIIQPLIENAVIHGIRGNPGGGNVSVHVERSAADTLVIRITDDGRGMSPQVAARINDYAWQVAEEVQAMERPAETIGLGLKNVIDRLHLFYDGRARIDVLSAEDSGSVIELSLPLDEGGEHGLEAGDH